MKSMKFRFIYVPLIPSVIDEVAVLVLCNLWLGM